MKSLKEDFDIKKAEGHITDCLNDLQKFVVCCNPYFYKQDIDDINVISSKVAGLKYRLINTWAK